MSALVTSSDREYSFVWFPRFVSNVHCDLSGVFIRDVDLNYLLYLVLFTVLVL